MKDNQIRRRDYKKYFYIYKKEEKICTSTKVAKEIKQFKV